MSTTCTYETMFKNTILQCPEENVYICDVQGFQRIAVDTFIFKEISFLNLKKTALPTAYLFKAPMPWKELTEEEKCMTHWMERSHHGIEWNSGDIPYHKLHKILQICTQGVKKLFVEGESKAQWLKHYLPNMQVFIIYLNFLLSHNFFSYFVSYLLFFSD